MIVHCADVADVIASVNFARDHGMLLAVRGGGHNGPGFGTCDGGLVIDLSYMKGVRVDPEKRTARVAGGSTWHEVDHATHAFGLATPTGIISTTGVGGLTLVAVVFGISALQPAFWLLLMLGPVLGAAIAWYLVRRGRRRTLGDPGRLTRVVLMEHHAR